MGAREAEERWKAIYTLHSSEWRWNSEHASAGCRIQIFRPRFPSTLFFALLVSILGCAWDAHDHTTCGDFRSSAHACQADTKEHASSGCVILDHLNLSCTYASAWIPTQLATTLALALGITVSIAYASTMLRRFFVIFVLYAMLSSMLLSIRWAHAQYVQESWESVEASRLTCSNMPEFSGVFICSSTAALCFLCLGCLWNAGIKRRKGMYMDMLRPLLSSGACQSESCQQDIISLREKHKRIFPPSRKSGTPFHRIASHWSLLAIAAAFLLPMSCSGGHLTSALTVVNISPRGGPSAGGTPVVISGNNFIEGNTFCKFLESGGVVTPVSLTSSRLLCQSPPSGGALRTTVQVTNNKGQTFYSSEIPYTYAGMCAPLCMHATVCAYTCICIRACRIIDRVYGCSIRI
jgi:hypothetical protein